MEQGLLRKQPVGPLLGLLLGAINEAAICAAQARFEDHASAYVSGIEALLNGLRQ